MVLWLRAWRCCREPARYGRTVRRSTAFLVRTMNYCMFRFSSAGHPMNYCYTCQTVARAVVCGALFFFFALVEHAVREGIEVDEH